MSRCRCGRRCSGRLCRDCEADERAAERAEHRRDDYPECPSCGGRTSGEGVTCYRCRRGDGIETDGGLEPFVPDGGREECSRCGYLLANPDEPCPYCGADPDADDGDRLRPDGGSIRGLEAGDDIERHLQNVLDASDDQEARFHARHALQYLEADQEVGR